MKKITTILCLAVLVAAFVFMFVFTVCLPRTTESNYSLLSEWPTFTWNSLFSGEYFKDVMHCFTDTIPAKDEFIDYETRINTLYGIEDDEKVIAIDPEEEDPDADKDSEQTSSEILSDDNSGAPSTNLSDIPPESTYIPSETESEVISDTTSDGTVEDNKQVVNASGSIIIIGTRAMEVYYGSEKNAVRYAEIMNDFAEKVGPSVNVYSMVIPKSSAYYIGQATQEKYSKLALRNKNNIDTISQTLSDKVIDVNIYNQLGLHANEEIYCRTDHHWTALGAYYASEVFAEKAGVGFDDISKFTEVRREGYLGTYYYVYSSKDNNTVLLNNPEDFLAYYPDADYTVNYYSAKDLESNERVNENGFFWDIPDNQKSNWYSTFLRGDSYSLKAVSNDCKNGRKLLIVKDSYGNALAPYMLEGFEEIYIVDAREYQVNLNETIKKFGITDVLFAQCTFSAVGGDYLNNLKELCK